MTGLPTRIEVSAGGVVYRDLGSGAVEVALILTHEGRWQLPKGWVEDGETPEGAALREVEEEAGIRGRVVGPIETIDYWFTPTYESEPVRIHKFVHFYLLEYDSGSTENHDDEVQEARWVALDEAVGRLSFAGERGVVTKVREALRKVKEPHG